MRLAIRRAPRTARLPSVPMSATYSPVTSRPLLAVQMSESRDHHRGACARQPAFEITRHDASPVVSNARAKRCSESRIASNCCENDCPKLRRDARSSRNGTGNRPTASTNRRMLESPPTRAARSISSVPYAYAVCPSGKRVVARLHRLRSGISPSRAAERAIVPNSVLITRPLPVSSDS